MRIFRKDLLDVGSAVDEMLTLHVLAPSRADWHTRVAAIAAGIAVLGVMVAAAALLLGGDSAGWLSRYSWLVVVGAVFLGLFLASLGLRWWLRRADRLERPAESLFVDIEGQMSGARQWRLTGSTAVVLVRKLGLWRVLVTTERAPRGVVLVRGDRSAKRATRVAHALADHLRVPVVDSVPEGESQLPLPCPTCKGEMRARQTRSCTIDYCRRCASFWLDGGEVALVYGEKAQTLVADLPEAPEVQLALSCPRDDDTLRATRIIGVPAHACPTCAGFFLSRAARNKLAHLAKIHGGGGRRGSMASGVVVELVFRGIVELLTRR